MKSKNRIEHVKLADILIYTIITLFSLACILPLLLLFIVSISNEESIIHNGYSFFPDLYTLEAYKMIFSNGITIFRSYGVSIIVTVVGTFLAVTITGMGGYTLANKNVRYRQHLSFIYFFTMLFNAGIVPWYMMCKTLGLQNNIFALIIPGLVFNPFNLFLVRNFMLGVPDTLMESAKLDGANDAYIAFKIYFPLCKPVLAAITLFYAIGYWNDWWNAIMLVDDSTLYPLQYLLFKLQSEIAMLKDLQTYSSSVAGTLPTESLKMATVMITIGPIILLYPFLQKYFVKGLIIGSVKA